MWANQDFCSQLFAVQSTGSPRARIDISKLPSLFANSSNPVAVANSTQVYLVVVTVRVSSYRSVRNSAFDVSKGRSVVTRHVSASAELRVQFDPLHVNTAAVATSSSSPRHKAGSEYMLLLPVIDGTTFFNPDTQWARGNSYRPSNAELASLNRQGSSALSSASLAHPAESANSGFKKQANSGSAVQVRGGVFSSSLGTQQNGAAPLSAVATLPATCSAQWSGALNGGLLQTFDKPWADFTVTVPSVAVDSRLTFTMSVLCANGPAESSRIVASTSIDVFVNAAPKGGDLSVQPSQGLEFFTAFKLEARGWVDVDLPLYFSFGFQSLFSAEGSTMNSSTGAAAAAAEPSAAVGAEKNTAKSEKDKVSPP
jgi:hypothetical protein